MSSEEIEERAGGDPTQVDDPDDYGKTRRLQQIFDLRGRIQDIRLRLGEGFSSPARVHAAKRSYAEAANTYIDELIPLLKEHDVGEYYLHEYPLDNWTIDPPDVELNGPREYPNPPVQLPGESDAKFRLRKKDRPRPPEQRCIELSGLADFVEQPNEREFTFDIWDFCVINGWDKHEYPVRATIPPKITSQAVQAANEFLRDIDLDLDTEEGMDIIREFDQSGGDGGSARGDHVDDPGTPDI